MLEYIEQGLSSTESSAMTVPDHAQLSHNGRASEIREADVVVDVAIPAYRRATYLGEAIESVLGQTFDRWRLTVCDNGPGGGEIEQVVRPYVSDPRVSYSASGQELSLAENWTRAMRQGTGPYVAILSDDDRWHPPFLEARVEALEAHPECGFVFSEWVQVDEHGNETARSSVRFVEGLVSSDVMAHWLTRQNIVGETTVVVRRSAFHTVGAAFDPAWHYADWELWARLAARFPAYYLPRCDSDWRRHTQAVTFTRREDPEQLLAMAAHVERMFVQELDGFRPGRLERARNRSRILLHSAGDVHLAGGWRRSGALYRRALREYPPSVFELTSLRMLAHTLVGRRVSRAVAQTGRFLRRRAGFGRPG
jgi:glycosyltransferase involved in cell wall biosynthesis